MGGKAIALQLDGNPGGWEHRYYAGQDSPLQQNAIQVSSSIPGEWQTVTRDLWADWGNHDFTLTGISFWPYDGNAGFWDNMYLHKSPTPPRPNWIKLSPSSGSELYYSGEQKVEVSLDLQSPGNYNGGLKAVMSKTKGLRSIYGTSTITGIP